jgi:CHAD domain-containing protein
MKNLWKDNMTLRRNLQRRFPKIVREYFAAGRAALEPGKTWTEMHQFRLESKRFRYTLELFRPAYGPGLERQIEAVKKVQTFLGDINDCVVTSGMLEAIPESEPVRAKLAEKADQKTQRLRKYWVEEFDAAQAEERWIQYLRTYVCRRRPARRAKAPAEEVAQVAEAPM